jgi:hypothetical protein
VHNIAIGHACHLEDFGVAPLAHSDVVDTLMHLYAKVGGEPEITHLELSLHLSLDVLHLLVRRARDDQVVHVDVVECLSSVATVTIDVGSCRLCWKPRDLRVLSSHVFQTCGV